MLRLIAAPRVATARCGLRSRCGALELPSRRSVSTTPPPPPPARGPLAWLLAQKAQLTELGTKYGYLSIATYLGVYVCTLGGIYVCVKAGAVTPPDVNTFINELSLKKALLGDGRIEVPPWGVDFATAWVLTKTTEPLRLVSTIALIPVLVRRLPPHVLAAFVRKKAAAAGPPAAAAPAAQAIGKHGGGAQ